MKRLHSAARLFSAALAASCAPLPTPSEPPTAKAEHSAEPAQKPSAASVPLSDAPCTGDAPGDDTVDTDDVEVIAPDRRVPEFSVAATDCSPLRSDQIVGKRPLVLVFFSSWCAVCDKKMPIVKRAIDELGGEATFLGVALDGDETWDSVASFIDRYDLHFPVVRGARFRRFAFGYNPFQTIPVVVVVGKNGLLVDLQVGYSPFDYNRLVGAIEVAKK